MSVLLATKIKDSSAKHIRAHGGQILACKTFTSHRAPQIVDDCIHCASAIPHNRPKKSRRSTAQADTKPNKMCGADRPSQNGAVAIIHRAVPSQSIRLFFRNPTHSSTANTVMSYETGAGFELGARQEFQQPMPDFMLQIQYVILHP